MRTRRLLAIGLGVLLVAACQGPGSEPTTTTVSGLSGSSWEGTASDLDDEYQITLTFEEGQPETSATGTITYIGSSGECRGTWSVIAVDPLEYRFVQRMATGPCGWDDAEIEALRIGDDSLAFSHAGGQGSAPPVLGIIERVEG
jgi:hypothetical protein